MKTFNIVNYTSNIIASIFTLILGVIIFKRPDLVIIMLSYVLGGFLLFIALCKIINYSYQKGKDKEYPLNDIIWALILIIIGLICIFLSDAIEHAVRFLIGGLILLAGINRFIKTIDYPDKKSKKFIYLILISILLIAFGLYIIFVSNLVISALGIVLIIYSVIEIINYIVMGKQNYVNIEDATIIEAEVKPEVKQIENKKDSTKNTKKDKK